MVVIVNLTVSLCLVEFLNMDLRVPRMEANPLSQRQHFFPKFLGPGSGGI